MTLLFISVLPAMPVDPEVMNFPDIPEDEEDLIIVVPSNPGDDEIVEEPELPSSVPEMLPFPTHSRGALKTYIMKSVSQGYIFQNSTSGGYTYRYFTDSTPKKIVDSIITYIDVVPTARPELETVDIGVYLRDSDDRTLLSARAYKQRLTQDEDSGEWYLNLYLTLVLQESVPIELPEGLEDTKQVKIISRDDKGSQKTSHYSGVYSGKFHFPSWMTGESGEIIFIQEDGEEIIYDLKTATRLSKVEIEINSGLTIDNYRELTLNGGSHSDEWISSAYLDDGTRRTAPLYRLEVTETSRFNVDGYTYYLDQFGNGVVEIPNRAWLEKVGNGYEEERFYDRGEGFDILLEPGLYWLWIEYDVLETPGWNAPPGKG